MNYQLRMSCSEVMDEIFESSDDAIPLLQRLRIGFHLFFCARCTEELRRLEVLRDISQSDFFPPAPAVDEKVMEQLSAEFFQADAGDLIPDTPGGISFRSWVIIGFIILVSLATSFFGIDFIEAAYNQDASYLIPLGITVGTVLTGYGVFFVASHLKELSEHFKIH